MHQFSHSLDFRSIRELVVMDALSNTDGIDGTDLYRLGWLLLEHIRHTRTDCVLVLCGVRFQSREGTPAITRLKPQFWGTEGWNTHHGARGLSLCRRSIGSTELHC
jgi:hypothetical protein